MKLGACVLFVSLLSSSLLAGVAGADTLPPAPPLTLEKQERLITILSTNDIHGGVEAGQTKDGSPIGGMAFWGGVTSAIREGLPKRFGADRAGVLVLDAGDQFQGTLISNFSEGQLVFSSMNEVGYDAAIPGNHDYDFGPIGWMDDQVTPSTSDQDPRGALQRVVSQAKFPLLSSNTYLKASLVDGSGAAVDVQSSGCRMTAVQADTAIDWSKAKRLPFLRPYVLKTVADVRVAIIGLDHPETPLTTTAANVSDLCFDDEIAAYRRIRKELAGQADIFVVVLHDGNTSSSFSASRFVERLPKGAVDAVIAGHTHYVNNARVRGVPIIQSGSGGLAFGRIDLVWDPKAHAVNVAKTRAFGGVQLLHHRCAPSAAAFCVAEDTMSVPQGSASKVRYEGVTVVPRSKILALLQEARAQVAPLATRKLGEADGVVTVNRTQESALANAMTDTLRVVANVDVAFMNAGGIRAPLAAGPVLYEDLFRVIPFNNHGLVVGPMAAEKVLALLERSVKTCGSFGALMQSGLRVTYERDCASAVNQEDPKARVLRVETLGGELIYEVASNTAPPLGRTFIVATLDFLAAGGSGFDGFKGTPLIRDLGVVREVMTEYFLKNPAHFSSKVDGRWAEVKPARP